MPWKASKSHESKSMSGKHFDAYHVDSSGNRDQAKSSDVHISGSSHEPSMRDVHPPDSSSSKK